MVYADLHVHTDHSDGQLALAEVPAAARRAGVQVVAVTDHDRIHPGLDRPVVEMTPEAVLKDEAEHGAAPDRSEAAPVQVIRGIELRVDAGDQRVDLLGYGVERTDDLAAIVEHVQADRKERGRKIAECVEDRLGVDLGIEPREGLGRPHIARAIDENPDTDLDYDDAFDQLIGDDGPCYVARDVPTFEEGVDVLDGACGLVSLAHPFRYPDPEAALALCADLDAVERFYPYGREVDPKPVERAVAEYDLAVTGGSDAHDDRLGLAGLSASDYRQIERAVTQGSSGGSPME